MNIRNRSVSLTAVTEFFHLVTVFRQTFLAEFTQRLNEPTTPENVATATVHDAFVSACQQCIAQLQTDGTRGQAIDSESKVDRAA